MKKILIIEDDPILSRMYQRIFHLHGYSVFSADSAELGYDKTKEHHPDVILLDVMLPKMIGLDLVPKIKKNHILKHIPIVILSNLAIQKDIDQVIKDGASLFIAKSDHEPKKILEKISKLINFDYSVKK